MTRHGLSRNFVRLDSSLYTREEELAYNQMVQVCHDLVEDWWDAHPEDKPKGYYYALGKASPEYLDKVTEWSLDYWQRREKQTEGRK